MADSNVNVSAAQDSGSAERVAFDLLKWMQKVTDETRRQQILDQYAECLQVTSGHRIKK